MVISARLGPLLFLLATLCLVGACGDGFQEGDTVRLRFAHVYETSAPTHACGAEHLPGRLAERDVGLDVRVYPASQLGNEEELLEQLVAGQLEMAIAGPSFLAAWHEVIGAFDAAYAFRDTQHMLEVARGPIGEELWEVLREQYGIRVLDTWPYGARHITSNRPIRRPQDLQGFRLRLPNARVWLETGRALGASPTPIAFAEAYLALQQGIADGQENPIPTIRAMGFHEVQSHLNLTGHIHSSTQVLISERIWQRLTPAQQEALQETVRQLADEVLACIEEGEEQILAQWRESGAMQIVEEVDLDAFRTRARDHFADGFAFSELYRRIVEEGPEAGGG